MDVTELLKRSAQHPTLVSRRSGVSRATIKRILDGVSQPTLATLRELALAQGLDVSVAVTAASDPLAAVAARILVEETPEQMRIRPEITAWIERLERYGLDEPESIVAEAGKLSTPTHGSQSTFFAPRSGIDQSRATRVCASAAEISRARYTISGAPAAAALLGREVPGPVILWTDGPENVATALEQTFRRTHRYQPAGVVVAPAPQEIFVGAVAVAGIQFAAPVQVVLDLHGAGMTQIATEIAQEW